MTYKEDNPGGYPGPPAPPEYQYHYCDLCGDELTEENWKAKQKELVRPKLVLPS